MVCLGASITQFLELVSCSMIQKIPGCIILTESKVGAGSSASVILSIQSSDSQQVDEALLKSAVLVSLSTSHGTSGVTWSQVAKRWSQKFWDVDKRMEMAFLEQVNLQKTFCELPAKFRVFFRQTRIAADHSSGTRNFPGFIGNVRHSRAACCLTIMKIFFFIQKVHVVQQVLNSEQKLIHGGGILFLLHGEFINSEMSDFIRLLTANSSLFIHFLAISCVRFLVDSVFRSEVSKFFFFCELGQPTGLFDVAPMSVIQVVEWFHRDPFQFFPNFFCNLFWAVRSPCKARSASFSMHSGRFFLSGRILSESCWDDDTLPKSRSFFPLKSDRSTFGEDSSLRYSFPELLTLDVCQRCITLDDAGFFSLPLATACWKNGDSEGICTSGSSVNSGEVNCLCSMVSVMSDATMVGTSLMSVVKLFFLATRFIGVYSLKISTRSLGS